MKNILIGLVTGLLLMSAVWWKFSGEDVKPVERDKTVAKDSARVDSLEQIIRVKTELQSQSDVRLIEKERIISALKQRGKQQDAVVDSLESVFQSDSNFTTCESLVIAQRCAITNKDSIINEYEDKNAEFEFNLSVMTDKYNLLDSASRIKDGTIEKLNINIERLNCYDVKMKRHRFIAWLFGLKCK